MPKALDYLRPESGVVPGKGGTTVSLADRIRAPHSKTILARDGGGILGFLR